MKSEVQAILVACTIGITICVVTWVVCDLNRYSKGCASKAEIINSLKLGPPITADAACAVEVVFTSQEILFDFDGMTVIGEPHHHRRIK